MPLYLICGMELPLMSFIKISIFASIFGFESFWDYEFYKWRPLGVRSYVINEFEANHIINIWRFRLFVFKTSAMRCVETESYHL